MEMLANLGGLLWTVAAFLVALSIIVAVHEYGHYIIGRLSGIKAEVFSLGFGPRLFARRDRRGTLWQVAALPLGGYVRFLGDGNAASAGAGETVDPALRRQTLSGAPLWARFATVAAGPIFNFILSILVFGAILIWQGVPVDRLEIGRVLAMPPQIVNDLRQGDEVLAIGGHPVATYRELSEVAGRLDGSAQQSWTVRRDGQELTLTGPQPMPAIVTGVAPRGPALAAGLKGGDVIEAIDGHPVTRFADLRAAVDAAEGRPVLLTIWREAEGRADYALVAREQDLPTADGFERRWLIGVTGGSFFEPATRPAGLAEALAGGVAQTWGVISSSVSGLLAMITGQIGTCNLGGAISIAETTGQAAAAGGVNFLWWIAMLSAAIGFLNLLPIPVLDGGHLMFFTYEAIFRRPASDQVMNFLGMLGLAMVLTLMIFGLSNDLFCP